MNQNPTKSAIKKKESQQQLLDSVYSTENIKSSLTDSLDEIPNGGTNSKKLSQIKSTSPQKQSSTNKKSKSNPKRKPFQHPKTSYVEQIPSSITQNNEEQKIERLHRQSKSEIVQENQIGLEKKKSMKPKTNKFNKKSEENSPDKKLPGNFDEVPIGKSSFSVSEFPEGGSGQKEMNYPMTQKLKSKALKLRLSGLEDLHNLLEDKPDHRDLEEVEMSKLLKETNPGCLQKVLYCFKLWIEKQKKWTEDDLKNVIQGGYLNGKQGGKKAAVQICDYLYDKGSEAIEMSILIGLKGKTPKNLAAYIAMIHELLSIYGIKRMKYLKPYIPEVVKILNREKLIAVKNEGLNLLSEACKWLTKEVVEPFIKDLKQNLKHWLDSFWQGYDKSLQMSAPKAIPEQKSAQNGKKLDAYEIAQAVDIFKKYNQKFCDSVIKEEKWSQKVKKLQEFHDAATTPKIAITDHTHVKSLLKRLIKDSNFNVVLWSLKILGALARGMRRPFANFIKSIFPDIVTKFRDKKTLMIEETFNTLNSFSYSISLEDVVDILRQDLNDKNPNMKENLVNWIGKFVEARIEQDQKLSQKASQALKSLFPVFQKLLSDSNSQVRDTMARNIGKMKILLGEQFFSGIENKMKKQISKKIEEEAAITEPKKTSKQKMALSNGKRQPERFKNIGKSPKRSPRPVVNLQQIERKQKQQNVCVPKGKFEESLEDLMPKMNHSDWEKRKESAEAISNILRQYSNKKINSHVLLEMLGILKKRIADPNKHIIKYFVQLTTTVFEILPEKQIKNNGRAFICGLADGLSDKMESNRKQICIALNRISELYGKQSFLSLLGPYLDTDRESRIQVVNLMIQNKDHFEKAETKDYPKGIIRCLSDRNKQIRLAGERIFQIILQKMGLQIFRNLAKSQRPAIAKDLNAIFDKYDKNKQKENLSVASKNSPNHRPPVRKRSSSRGKSEKSEGDNRSQFTSTNKVETQKNIRTTRPSFKTVSQSKQQQEGKKQVKGQKPRVNTNLNSNANSNSQKLVNSRNKEKQISSTTSIKPLEPIIYLQKKSLVEKNRTFADIDILLAHKQKRREKDEENPWLSTQIKQDQEQQLVQYLNTLINEDLVKKMLSFNRKKVLEYTLDFIKLCKDHSYHNQIKQIYDIILKFTYMRLFGGIPSLVGIIEVLPPLIAILQKKKINIQIKELQLVLLILRQYFISLSMSDGKSSESIQTLIRTLLNMKICEPQEFLRKILKQYHTQLPHKYIKNQSIVFYRKELNEIIKNNFLPYLREENILEEISNIKELKADQQFNKYIFKEFHPQVLACFGFTKLSLNLNTINSIKEDKLRKRENSTSKFLGLQKRKSQGSRSKSELLLGTTVNSRESKLYKQKCIKERQIKSQQIEINYYNSPHPATPLGKYLDTLLPYNQKTVNFFKNLFSESGSNTQKELKSYSQIIFGSILKSVIVMMENRYEYEPEDILNQMSLLIQTIKCQYVMKNAKNLIEPCIKFSLPQLIYEDANQQLIKSNYEERELEYNPDKFIKNINGIMRRILENANPQQTANSLLKLIILQISGEHKSIKTLHTEVKCLGKVYQKYTVQLSNKRTQNFMILLNEFLNFIELSSPLQNIEYTEEKLKQEETTVKFIKEILTKLVKTSGEKLRKIHNTLKNSQRYKFSHDFIPSFLEFHEVPVPENMNLSSSESELELEIQFQIEKDNREKLKQICKMLSNQSQVSKSEGVEELKKYLLENPEFQAIQYFIKKGIDEKVVLNIMNRVEGRKRFLSEGKRKQNSQKNINNSNQRTDESLNGNNSPLKQKIKKLKAKLQQVNKDKPAIFERSEQMASMNQNSNSDRNLDIKRKINEMKNKMNLANH